MKVSTLTHKTYKAVVNGNKIVIYRMRWLFRTLLHIKELLRKKCKITMTWENGGIVVKEKYVRLCH